MPAPQTLTATLISSLAECRTETPQTRKMPAPTGPGGGRIAMKKSHQTRSKKPRRRTLQITTGRVAGRRASFSGGCCISGNSRTPHGPRRRRRDDDDPKYEARLVRPRAPRPARAPCMRWAWRGRDPRRGSRRVRVVCHAERRRDKFKRQRRGGVMVCVSVFVTHQEARGCF